MARTLGSDFFQPDIIPAEVASGENPNDPSANRDVTPERFSKLEKELVRGKGEIVSIDISELLRSSLLILPQGKRLSQLSEVMVQIDFLYTELGISPPSLDDLPAASSSSASLHHTASSSSMNDDDPFLPSIVSTPTPSCGSGKSSTTLFLTTQSPSPSPAELQASYQRIFARFAAQIEEAESENLNLAEVALTNVDPTPGLLSWASSLCTELNALKSRREAHIQAMYDQLEGLWGRFGVSEEDMDGFVEAHRGSTEEIVQEYEEELERMTELKRERMGVFVENARMEIERLWDDMMVGDDERRDFAALADGKTVLLDFVYCLLIS